jgi:hypothetical protein
MLRNQKSQPESSLLSTMGIVQVKIAKQYYDFKAMAI